MRERIFKRKSAKKTFKRKSVKEFSRENPRFLAHILKENPRKNIKEKIRYRTFERKSAKEYSRENPRKIFERESPLRENRQGY